MWLGWSPLLAILALWAILAVLASLDKPPPPPAQLSAKLGTFEPSVPLYISRVVGL